MVFGLFKSKKTRMAEAREAAARHNLKTLERFDPDQRGAVALNCATRRLAELQGLANAEPDLADRIRQVWYDPLQADLEMVAIFLEKVSRSMQAVEQQFILAHAQGDAAEQTHLLVLAASLETWYQTWLACIQPDLRPTVVQTWKVIATGFPHVEASVAAAMAPDQPPQPEQAIAMAKRVIADGPDGPDYRRIPLGFGPAA